MFVKTPQKKNTIVGLKELRNNIETYIRKIHRGESFTIVRRSQPIFTVSPPESLEGDDQWETIVDFSKIHKNGVSAEAVLKVLRRLNA